MSISGARTLSFPSTVRAAFAICLMLVPAALPAKGPIPKTFPEHVFESGARKNLIWEYGFEQGWNAYGHSGHSEGSSQSAPRWKQSQMQGPYSGRVVDSPVRAGKKAMRFEWRPEGLVEGKKSNTSKKATVFTLKDPTAQEERWWGFSMYLPSEGMEKDSQPEILVQWHGTPDKKKGRKERWRNPPLTLSNNGDQLKLSWIYDPRPATPPKWSDWDRRIVSLGDTPKDRWVDFVFRIKWDPFGKGLLQVWKDGRQVLSEMETAIGFNDLVGTYMGVGIYKYTGTSDHARRVIYFDEVRGASRNGTYADVAP
jgi:hypothetical protein